MKGSENFVRILLRGPHAHEIRDKEFKDKNVSMPGIVFLDPEGKPVAIAELGTAKQLMEKMNELTK